ncbi:VCBS repeat-containing protein [Algibacter sp. L3A6]|uniref:VCBS repeat-containing protein n=1 Tax=Algibacter sp. L3A6 TaxID=2686366 RepID=UPI00131D3E27|nr:VCBS repeat-containing protein [Algibacter sp. L3A6]
MEIKHLKIHVVSVICFVILISCSNEKAQVKSIDGKIFSSVEVSKSGIDFKNILSETDKLNYFTYAYMYMGAGVSAGDINNDGLIDLFFTGNQAENKLYLNKGGLNFEDITTKAGVSGDQRWYTGTTMVDINNDGFLDIYCSVSGKFEPRNNQLFINNHDGTFTESATAYGLDDASHSIQATFFDYDKDGDLDVYVANYPPTKFGSPTFVYQQNMRNVKAIESDHLYRNDDNTFTDVSEEAGIKNFGLTLSATVGDLNNDSWPDIYVSNDFDSPDLMFLNQKDGTFSEVIKQATSHTAFYGMGADISDFNNDGNLDIFQADMDAEDNKRQKANMSSMNPQLFTNIENAGFQTQYMQNCMQVNSGVYPNGIPHFSNISRLAGVSSTDWSWGPLFADFDNDGFKDLYISNGSRREIHNNDFFNNLEELKVANDSVLYLVEQIPSEKLDNYMYQNKGDFNFKRVNKDWGIEFEGFSNGVIYADLDNDGDLEIVTNNIDDYASVFENKSSEINNYLMVSFKGKKANAFGLGARVYITTVNKTQMQELTLTRGFESSVAPILHFGLGKQMDIEVLKVVWPDGKIQQLKNLKANQELVLSYTDAIVEVKNNIETDSYQKIFSKASESPFPKHKHVENNFDDFEHQVLMPHKMSAFGPALAVGDLNGDGLDDYFIGGSHENSGAMYFQNKEGGFEQQSIKALLEDKSYEDISALIFDADKDNDNDLYIVSGGYEFATQPKLLQDRLYINDGAGNFIRAKPEVLPEFLVSGSKVYNADFDKDGKDDLLVLGRQMPGKYPMPVSSYVLRNVGEKGTPKFNLFEESYSKVFENIGMATSAVITDFNNDSWPDVILVGEWMPIKVYKNIKTGFEDVSETMGLSKDTTGWWWSIEAGDFDNDGDIDYILGNNGLNYKYKATENETFDIFVNDFDNNHKTDIVLSYFNKGKQYPVRGRSCSSQQIPGIKSKFKNYETFSQATLVDVYTKKALESSLHYSVQSFASIYLENKNNHFVTHQLPIEAQMSSINKIIVEDFDKDTHLDALLVGNLYVSEVETPRNDASYGLLLKGNGQGEFNAVPANQSGFFVTGDSKDMQSIAVKNETYILIVKNNDSLDVVKVR